MGLRICRFAQWVAVAALVVSIPVMPALWRGLTDLSGAVNGIGSNGYIQISSCERGPLYFDWSCRGRFEVNDPDAEPYRPVPNTVLANDAAFHGRGAQVQSERQLHTHDAYLWGGAVKYRTVGAWIGIASCLLVVVAGALKFVRRLPWAAMLLVFAILGGVLALSAAAFAW